MGTWGTGPFDDDTALDWFGDSIQDMLQAAIEKSARKGAREEYQPGRAAVRVALMLCADGHDRILAPVFNAAKALLEKALGDERYLASWPDKRTAVEAELREELLAVEAALKRHAEFEKQHPPSKPTWGTEGGEGMLS